MRTFLTSSVRRPSVGWLWAVALLVLPACDPVFRIDGVPDAPVHNLNQGVTPRSGLIFCDIEKPLGRHCASDAEKIVGTRLAAAATALTSGQSGVAIGLDDSRAALGRCGGEPEAVTFQCPFPGGCEVCLNCGGVIGPIFPDAN